VPLLARTVTTPLAVEIAEGAVERLPDTLAEIGVSRTGSVALVTGHTMGTRLRDVLTAALPDAEWCPVTAGTVDEARRVESELRGLSVDAVVALGGGATLDVAKWASTMVGLPFVAVATNLAHDGIASPVAVLDGVGARHSFGVHMPLAVVVDLALVAGAPDEQLRSGIGDVVANLQAVADWRLGASVRGERFDGLAAALALGAARSVACHRGPERGHDFLETLADGLVVSGVAMAVAGSSRPCSGACHEISHSIDRQRPGTALHGAQVAVGALFAAFLRGGPDDADLAIIDECFRRHGVARTPKDLGLGRDEFVAAVVDAPSTRPDRYTILEHLDLAPAEVADTVDAFVEAIDR
jgi:glycerol-1-phosphate dehydrogenase [NAD(P)+]